MGDDEIAELAAVMETADVGTLPPADESAGGTLEDGLDEDAVTEFMDRLEGNDIAADIYLPVEFEGRLEAADFRVASLQALADVLEGMAEEMDIEEEEDEEDEGDEEEDFASEIELLEDRLRHIWRIMFDAAQQAVENGLCLIVSK
jgi:hypothetical protein